MWFRFLMAGLLSCALPLVAEVRAASADLVARCTLSDNVVVQECVEALTAAESVSDPSMRKLHLERAIKAMESRAAAAQYVAELPLPPGTPEPAETRVPGVYMQDKLPRDLPIQNILTLLQQLRPQPEKGEFETTAAFEARHSAWAERPFKGRVRGNEAIAIEVRHGGAKRGLQITYDADRQQLQAEVPLSTDTPAPGAWLETIFTGSRLGARNAKTVMGIPFRVESWSFSSVGLSVKSRVNAVTMSAALSTAEAQRLKPHLRVLAIVQPDAPFVVHEVQNETASLSSPTESRFAYLGLHAVPLALLLYDPRDGRVYARSVGEL